MKNLDGYINIIKRLPNKEKYTREDLLTEGLLLDRDKNLEIYYIPISEKISICTRVFIVGITPGFEQMSTYISNFKNGLENSYNIYNRQSNCKISSPFSKSLTKNIIYMLDEVKLNEALNIKSCEELFNSNSHLLYTDALIPYPVFVNGKNYTGHTPKLMKNKLLMKYINNNFKNKLEDLKGVLIIPMGKAVEEVLIHLADEKILDRDQILIGFPHPSGANAYRLIQLKENKDNMIKIIKKHNFNL
ncbi:hypothetical protein [Romboutsia sp. 1001216sp1]|uniref:hypothetical protein n=1 Tax=Romboutsia sp. 1001216sp1 TaxID=2986997 RepID=UPI00232D81FF|nr:hypothetical protein [Romboutsia sp. 1001216sp1]MDB8804959.1 hypothetical protein [Romboutsia sp. 1001216sp1]MDB8807949.1 hypothetical protein [Romboutsia sp. 1001216sp1]MDB8810604.1 hypothetical protein [Romboutsia sp. 1001216sp1]MDB8816324.1 hypothetical protein [Romboutsia sp. 1001216sp1]MDB8818723.1 hypothetical protein [Romboutsia sp. 1001216sp1]